MTKDERKNVLAKYKDEIEALRIIYNNAGEPLTYTMLKDLQSQPQRAQVRLFDPTETDQTVCRE